MHPRLLAPVLISAAVALPAGAAADPVLELPPVGRASLLRDRGADADPGVPGSPSGGGRSAAAAGSTDPARLPGQGGESELALVGEVSALAVLGAERLTIFPDVDDVSGGEPELALARIGLVGWSGCRPVGFAVRLDLAEGLRLDGDELEEEPLASAGAMVDDLYLAWTPRSWAQVWVGRQPVPFSRFRQVEHALLTGGAVPFVIDRVAPERRWGAAVHGDLGALAYALGGYADGGAFELRPARQERAPEPEMDPDAVPGPEPRPDPSAGGRAALAAHVEWTPRAPMGPGPVASPREDPWYDTPRASAGAGVLWRLRDGELGNRVDLTLSGAGKWRGLSALLELILTVDGDLVALAAAGEAGYLATDRLHLFVRGDHDIEAGWWTAGAGAAWFVTADRWNKVSLLGWLRRQTDDDGPDADGVIVQLQAAL
ncbi:MAG TPA: hypothetical protein VKZ63_17975 [Kofleriaceae bacterium]|nr:hypothetical protein [Kofleriaceae bacterium]